MGTDISSYLRNLLIGAVLCLIVANGVNTEASCRKGCPKSDNGILQYVPGNVYEYNFDSIMTVGLSDASIGGGGGGGGETDDTSLKIFGTAKIFSEGNCGYTLQLGAVKVSTTKESIEKKILQSIEKPVHFTMVSGKLEPELCADIGDTVFALNTKRAIISLLQSNKDAESESEVDVFGQCATHTLVSKVGGAEVVTKIRNLNSCAYREKINSGIVNGVVNDKSGIKSTMLLKADYAKETKLNRGVIDNVHLAEEYKFAGASKGGPNVRAKVTTSLKLKNAAGVAATAPATGTHSISIIFQSQGTYVTKNIAALKAALSDVIQLVGDYVQKDSAKNFIELIRLMREADTETLLELSNFPHPNKVLARKAYLDALFRVGTAESAKAIIKQLPKMNEKEKLIATLSLNLIQTVDKDTLTQATTLLTPNAGKGVFLAVGNLVSKYCQHNECDKSVITPISKKFTDNLKHCKANTKKDEERILYILKGIGNTQHLASSVAGILSECAAVGHSNRIRVAALQAFSAASCDVSLAKKAMELLHDRNEDSELRIEAYLAVINCPTAEVVNELAELINSETVYQVGGFIASNLKAIRDSTDSTREHQRHYLGNIRVTKNFPKDYRRYSFNNEVSYKLDALGLSASSDYKLVYSQHGFLPRSARLNVSTEVFGTNFNVLEASIRQENIENLLEYYVGPKGLLNKDFDEIMKVIEVGGGGVAGGRARRSIADESSKFAKKYKTYGNKNAQDLNLDLSLKLFGSEMMFLSLGDNIPGTLDDIIKQFSMAFEDAKKELSSFSKEFIMHSFFMDTSFVYPTGIGIPLELSSQGFAATKLDFAINIDIDTIMEQNWQRAKYRLKFVPSAEVNVNVKLSFNAHVLETGIRLVSNMHSASGSDINVAFINDGNGFNMDIELPREKMELVDLHVNTDFFVAEQYKSLKSIPLRAAKKRNFEPTENCFNQLEAVGFTLCFASSITDLSKAVSPSGKAQVSTEDYDLGRPFSFTVYITSEKKFNLKGTYTPHSGNTNEQWKLNFSTPGSKESHDTSIAFELGTTPRTFGRISFDNPQYHFGLEAGVNNNDKELIIYAQYEHNDDVKKNKIGFEKKGNTYRPIIEIQGNNGVTNDINGYRTDGQVVVEKTAENSHRYTFQNFQIVTKDGERVVVNGWADVSAASLNSELRIAPGQHAYFIKSNFKLENGEYVVGLFVNDEKTPDNVMGGLAQIKLNQNYLNVQLVGKAGTWEVNSANEFNYEKPEQSSAVTSSKFKNELSVKNKNNIIGSFKLSGFTEAQSKFEIEAEVARGKKISTLSVKYAGNEREENNYNLEVHGKHNKHFVGITAKCQAIGGNFVIENVLTTSWGTSLTVMGELGQRYTSTDVHIDLQGTAQFSGKEKPTQWLLKVIGAPEKTISDFKLSRDNADLIKYNGEITHPQDKVTAGKVNVLVKNVLIAKSDFKVAKNGKGEVTATVEMLKTEPKHKIEINSKFHILAPKYDVEATVTFDADKKLYFKTENNLDKTKLLTKNIVEVDDKKITFDATGTVKGEWRWNGEVQGNFALILPSGRAIDGNLKRKVTTNAKNGLAQGTADFQLNDQLPDGQKQSISGTGKMEKFNLKAKEYSVSSHFTYTSYAGKNLEIDYHVKHLPKGDNKMLDINYVAKGDVLLHPFDISVIVDEYSANHAVYRVSGKYAEQASINVNGNYQVNQPSQLCKYELQGKFQVPQSNFKTIEIKSSGKLMKPEVEDSGAYLIELHVDEVSGNDQFIKFNTVLKGSKQQGAYNLEVETKEMQGPLKLEGSYQREDTGNFKEGKAGGKQKHVFNFNYADKYVKSTADTNVGIDTTTVLYTLDTSFESAKDIRVEVSGQKLVGDSYAVKLQAQQGANAYKVDSKIFSSTHKKGLDLHAALPGSKPIVVVGFYEILGERKVKLTMQVENLVDLDLNSKAEASYKSVDDFYILADWNSAKLNLNNYDLDVRSQGKAITFNLKNAKGVIFAGSATYALKKEKNKSVIEGQGQLTYKGKSESTNFRLIHKIYDIATDKEVGISYTFNGNFGPKNGVSTLKLTNKDFNVKLSICEEKKQCTNIQVQSLVTADDKEIDPIQHSLLILIDLRELGYPYEFEFQSKTIQQGLKFQYSLDSNIISNNNMKYQLVANVLPTNFKVQLKLPSREILLETQQKFPEPGHVFGHYENSIAFYLDKTNKPNDVTRLISSADVTGAERVAINAKGQIKFEHPTIRPLTISGKFDANREQQIVDAEVVFDIFHLAEQQVIATTRFENTLNVHGFNVSTSQSIRSDGLGIQYELKGHSALNIDQQELSAAVDVYTGTSDLKASAFVYANKDGIQVLVNALNEQLVQLNGEFNREKYLSKFNSKLHLFGQKPLELETELQPTQAKFSVKRQGLIDVITEIKLGKEIKINVEGIGKQLINGRVALDAANFLQTTYKSNDDNIKSFLETTEAEVKKETEESREKIKQRFEKLRESIKRQVQLSKDSTPDFSKLKSNYENNVNEIVKELQSDPSLQQISETYRQLYTKFAKIAGDIAKTSAESYENLHKSVVALYAKFEIIFKDTIIPAWEGFMLSATKIIGELRIHVISLNTKTFQAILSILEKYGPTLKNYGKTISEALKPFNEALLELFKVSANAIEEFLQELKEYVAKLPTFEALRIEFHEKLQKLKLVEKSLEFINNVFDQLHIMPVTPETSEFLDKAHEYIKAKLSQQPTNDEKLIEEILKLFVRAVRSIWTSISITSPDAHGTGLAPSGFSALFSSVPFSFDTLTKLPALLSFRFSVFNFLLNESWDDIFSKDHLKSWIFFHDFQLQGHIADGHNIFTFDGQYISFPGSCKYILAQDSVDNNFTVIAQLNNGKLKAITLTDRDGGFMEINDAGVLKLNGNAVEYPQHTEEGMHAWRKFYTVYLHSSYGVQLMCTADLKVCHIDVNGFYTSKTRGLLGNGNAEPHDDFVQVDGTLAADYATFGNGYGLGKCTPVASQPLVDTHDDLCNEFFGYDSPLALGYLLVNSAQYRTACDNAVAAAPEKDKEAAACAIALSYGSTLKLNHVLVQLPARCLKCAGVAGQRDLYQEFTVKIPNNKADVVFVVDVGVTPTVLSQLVAPVVTEMRDTLKARGLTDIQIGVIAYNESQRYPALLTSDNGKLNYQGNLADVQLNGPKHFCENCVSQVVSDRKLLEVYEIIERLIKTIVPQPDEAAFETALNYPFRAGAAKSIVGVRSNSLEFVNLFKFVRAHFADAVTNFDAALLHLIGPVKDMSLEGVPAEKLVGFNARLVATLDGKDAKKRSKLQFENDMGIDFVLNNSGWVFATQNFENLKAQDKKKALNQVTNSIADTMFKTEIVSDCKCVPVYGLHAQHKCSIKSSTFVPNKKVKGA